MRSLLRFIFPPDISVNLRTRKEWPPSCDHKIAFAEPLWIRFDAGDFLMQSVDGGDYRIESRSFTVLRPLHLYIKADRPGIGIVIVLEGLLEGKFGNAIAFHLDAKNYSVFYLPDGMHQLNLVSGKSRWVCFFPPLLHLKSMAIEEPRIREIARRLMDKEKEGAMPSGFPLPVKLLRIVKRIEMTKNKGMALDFELRRYMLEILAIYNTQAAAGIVKRTCYQSSFEKVIAVRDHILAHLGDMDLGGLNEMALRFHTNSKSLNSSFFKLTGKTIPKFIGDERLEWARRLLEKKEMHVFEIAWITGFSDTANFNRKFKKKYGYPPLNRKSK